jgi:hypothetical protein
MSAIKVKKEKEPITFVSTLRDLRKAIASVLPDAKVEKMDESHYTVLDSINIQMQTICKWTPDGKKVQNECAPYAIVITPNNKVRRHTVIKAKTFKQRPSGSFDFTGICAAISQIMEDISKGLVEQAKWKKEDEERKERDKQAKVEFQNRFAKLEKMIPKKLGMTASPNRNDYRFVKKVNDSNLIVAYVYSYQHDKGEAPYYFGIHLEHLTEREAKEVLEALTKIKFDKREKLGEVKIEDVK